MNLWRSAEHALAYLEKADTIPNRVHGERTLLDLLPPDCSRVLDLGTGDGRLAALVLAARPDASLVALDFSPVMLGRARERFAGDARVTIIEHDLDHELPIAGPFDAVVSSFAIHHCADTRKRSLYGEVFGVLRGGGVFANLEHVSSPTDTLHQRFLAALAAEEDPSNQLAPLEDQLLWLRDAGFTDVDCHWKWLELALLGGARPADLSR